MIAPFSILAVVTTGLLWIIKPSQSTITTIDCTKISPRACLEAKLERYSGDKPGGGGATEFWYSADNHYWCPQDPNRSSTADPYVKCHLGRIRKALGCAFGGLDIADSSGPRMTTTRTARTFVDPAAFLNDTTKGKLYICRKDAANEEQLTAEDVPLAANSDAQVAALIKAGLRQLPTPK